MIQERLMDELDLVARRFRRFRFWTALAATWLSFVLLGLFVLMRHAYLSLPLWIVLAGVLLTASVVCLVITRRTARDRHWVAMRIEAKYPGLDSRLLTAVQEVEQSQHGRLGFLQERVVRQALSHNHVHRWYQTVGTKSILIPQLVCVTCLLGLIGISMALLNVPKPVVAERQSENPLVDSIDANEPLRVTVEPGTTEVERGKPLLVTARFGKRVPVKAELIAISQQNEQLRFEMSRSLDDPLFAKRVAKVDEGFSYRVEFTDGASETYQVQVYDLPDLEQMDVELQFPEYTHTQTKLVADTRRVTAVIGTQLTIICRLNKSVASAQLVAEQGETLTLAATVDNPTEYRATLILENTTRYKLQLRDEAGRENREQTELIINATQNRVPEIVVIKPARDVVVSPLEELPLQATFIDDFGLTRFGLSYQHFGHEPVEQTLGENSAGNEKRIIDHTLFFEDLGAKPGDLVSYFFWAEDIDSSKQPRKILSDMYFAEVRPFDEIFRQGDQNSADQQQRQQQQQQSQMSPQAEPLLELQKQIITATWNLIRQAPQRGNEPKFRQNIELIEQSQRDAVEQLQAAADSFAEAPAGTMEAIEAEMIKAADALQQAREGAADKVSTTLQTALAAEQNAYQQMLRLKPNEHDVVRGSQQQSSSSSQANSRSQQQLQQLQLSNEENRYEQRQQANAVEDQQQQENRQVLNRLRELAQRQSDLNRQLKEMQSALEEAANEEEREEIERRLKRLRDQQEEILRDIDELKERTENSENQQEMAETNQQLDEAREDVRRSSEALNEEKISQAAASGTKAQERFEDMRDEMRRRTAGQFADEMTQMRDQANELAEKQDAIEQKLDELADSSAKSLRDTDERQKLEEEIGNQGNRLGEVLDDMQGVIQEAEQSEPLLSKGLYDAFREAKQQELEESLEETRELLSQGFVNESRESETQAKAGVDNLREAIDRAADSVIGDETESLRRAKEILEQLGDQLNEEIAASDPNAEELARAGDAQRENNSQKNPRDGDANSPRDGESKSKTGDSGNEKDARKGSSQSGNKDGESKDSAQQQDDSSKDGKGKNGDQQQSKSGQSKNGKAGSENESQQSGDQPGKGQSGRGQSVNSPQESEASEQDNGSQPTQGQEGNDQPGRPGNQQGGGQGGGPFDQLTESWENAFGPPGGGGRPLTGENFREWSDRLRDVEEMLDDAELRAQAARIREQAREIRIDLKRHSKEPEWDVVREFVAEPLERLKSEVARELLKRQSREALVPIDRQPVPPGFERAVREYYERLGSGE